MNDNRLWVFGYGSLLWRPGFDYEVAETAHIAGWERRFWQGSPDHRGTPGEPGRVVTLVPRREARCTGRLYGVPKSQAIQVLEYLDVRESGGYQRLWLNTCRASGVTTRALTYVALAGNPHYLGPASSVAIRDHIDRASGPSGANSDYCSLLVQALLELPVSTEEWQTLPVERP